MGPVVSFVRLFISQPSPIIAMENTFQTVGATL
jgi:hypothetical protein